MRFETASFSAASYRATAFDLARIDQNRSSLFYKAIPDTLRTREHIVVGNGLTVDVAHIGIHNPDFCPLRVANLAGGVRRMTPQKTALCSATKKQAKVTPKTIA